MGELSAEAIADLDYGDRITDLKGNAWILEQRNGNMGEPEPLWQQQTSMGCMVAVFSIEDAEDFILEHGPFYPGW